MKTPSPFAHEGDFVSSEKTVSCHGVMGRFWGYLKKYKSLIWVTIAGNIFTVSIVVIIPLLIKLVIDEAIPAKNIGLLVGVAVGLFCLQAIRMVVGLWHNLFAQYIGQRVVIDMRMQLFHHLQLLHLSFYENRKTSSLVSHVVSDALAIQQFINSSFGVLSNACVAFILSLIVMFFIHPYMTLFCLLTLPFYYAIIIYYRRRLEKKDHEVKERQSQLAGHLGETFAGIKVVKSFAQEDHERKRFVLALKNNFSHEIELPYLGSKMGVVLEVLFFFVYAMVVLVLGVSTISGGISTGSFVAYISYLWMLYGPLGAVAALIQSSTSARTSFERILTLLDTKPLIREDDHPLELKQMVGRIDFNQVEFSYGDRVAIRDFNLQVKAGEVIAFVGQSGSGKSTLMSLITRFYDVTRGEILVDGIDLRRLKYDDYRNQLGIVLQENFLFSGTIEENIRYGRPQASDEEVLRAARLANAWEFIEKLPKRMKSEVGQSGVTLSGGQRQRIAIARCILKDPKILIFDEATSALDTQSEALIQHSMDTLMRGRTVFIVAHRLTTIQKADRIVVMNQGRIVEMGSHQQLLKNQGAYYDLYRPKVVSSPVEEPFNQAV